MKLNKVSGAKAVKPVHNRTAGGRGPSTNGIKGANMGTAASIKVPNPRPFNTKNMPQVQKNKEMNTTPDKMKPTGKTTGSAPKTPSTMKNYFKQATAGTAVRPLKKAPNNYKGS